MRKGVFLVAVAVLGTLLTATPAFASDGAWRQDSKGWWYQNADGSYVKSAWISVNGTWYHMDGAGYMQTGWLNDGGKWYYLDVNNGNMLTGWANINDLWYYLDASKGGYMLTDTFTPDGYYVDEDGIAWAKNNYGNDFDSDSSIAAIQNAELEEVKRAFNDPEFIKGWRKAHDLN